MNRKQVKKNAQAWFSILIILIMLGLPLLAFLMSRSCGLSDAMESLMFGDGMACEIEFIEIKLES